MNDPMITGRPGREEELPDYSGVDLDDLLARVTHPALSAVLTGLAGRSRRPQDAAAYHDDAPDTTDTSDAHG